jgi:hypothetical protein
LTSSYYYTNLRSDLSSDDLTEKQTKKLFAVLLLLVVGFQNLFLASAQVKTINYAPHDMPETKSIRNLLLKWKQRSVVMFSVFGFRDLWTVNVVASIQTLLALGNALTVKGSSLSSRDGWCGLRHR